MSSWMPLEGSEIFHRRERVFLSFPVRLWGGDRRSKGVHDRRANCKSLFATFQASREYLRKCVTDRIYLQVGVIWLNAFTGFNDVGSCSSFAWWFHRNIFFVRFSQSKVLEEVKKFFFWDKGCLSRVAFLYLGEGTGHAIVLEHHQPLNKLVI